MTHFADFNMCQLKCWKIGYNYVITCSSSILLNNSSYALWHGFSDNQDEDTSLSKPVYNENAILDRIFRPK